MDSNTKQELLTINQVRKCWYCDAEYMSDDPNLETCPEHTIPTQCAHCEKTFNRWMKEPWFLCDECDWSNRMMRCGPCYICGSHPCMGNMVIQYVGCRAKTFGVCVKCAVPMFGTECKDCGGIESVPSELLSRH